MTLAAIIGLGVAKWLAGATVTPDLLRFGQNTKTVVTTTVAEFLIGNFGFNLLGVILGLGLGKSDLGIAFGLLGLTRVATVAFILQSITVEMNELYAASLAASNAIGMRRTVTNVIVGIGIGFYGISQGIIATFLTFIGYVGYALPRSRPLSSPTTSSSNACTTHPDSPAYPPSTGVPSPPSSSRSPSTSTSAWPSATCYGTRCP